MTYPEIMSTATLPTKYVYEKLPKLNPTFYRSWANRAQIAFAERGWESYLKPPDKPPDIDDYDSPETSASPEVQTDFNPIIDAHARALLTESIPDEHHAMIEDCTAAWQIWQALQDQFASQNQ